MAEVQKLQWLVGRPACAHVHLLTQEMTDVFYHTNDQQKESYTSRQQSGCKDTQIVIDFVERSSSFEVDQLSL